MISAEIKKGKGIEELLAGYGGQAETASSITKEGRNGLSEVMRKYETVLQAKFEGDQEDTNFVRLLNSIDDVLTPDEINTFLQSTIQHEDHQRYTANTGIFISRLIQNSYEAGQNQFHLNTTNLKNIDELAAEVQGEKEEPVEVTITGDTGRTCGCQARNAILNIQGNTGYACGWFANESTFNITGNTGDDCGNCAEYSTFNIQGNAGYECGSVSRNSIFNIQGNTGYECGRSAGYSIFNIQGNTGQSLGKSAWDSTFIVQGTAGENNRLNDCGYRTTRSTFVTSRQETAELFNEVVWDGNRVIFILDTGEKYIVRDYDEERFIFRGYHDD